MRLYLALWPLGPLALFSMAVVERIPSAPQRLPTLLFGPFAFDTHTRLLTRDGQELALPPRVLGVLELLLERAGDVVPRQALIDTVWKDAFVTDTSLAEAVSVLRQVLGDDPQSPTYIQTRHRRGYRFVAAVTIEGLPAPAVHETPSLKASAPPPADEVVSPSIGGQLVPWSAAVICGFIAIAAVWQMTRHNATQSLPAARFTIAPVAGTVLDAAAPAVAVSPDGQHITWSACDGTGCRLYIRPIDRLDASVVAGTDGAQAPFFSSDNRWIAFFADGRLKKVALAGGTPATLADASTPLGGVWIDREVIFAGSPSGGLMRVPADGGEPRALTAPNEGSGEVRHAWPSVIPGTRIVIFTIDATAVDDVPGLLGVLSLDQSPQPQWRTLVADAGIARAFGPDALIFARGTELQAIAFDAARQAISGAPRTALTSVATTKGQAIFAVSQTGTLVYADQGAEGPGGQRSSGAKGPDLQAGLGWWSPVAATDARATFDSASDIRDLHGASLAPDGARVAGVKAEGVRTDIWVADVQRGAATRLTHSGTNSSPVWSADGRSIFYASRTDGPFEIWSRDADGARPATRLFASDRHALPLASSPDGRLLAFLRTSESTRADIWVLPLASTDSSTGSVQARPLVQGSFDEHALTFSPDAKLIAFESAETGRWEIYVQRITDNRRVVVSTDGGERPVWTKDGLFYQSRGRVMRATIADIDGELRIAHLAPVTGVPAASLRGISPAGRFLLDRAPDLTSSSLIVSLDWRGDVLTLLGPPALTLPR
jgi:DNA-binding winged helix-turn-helix (wHTH) protein/Tol biopolymer transport system component